MTNRHFKHVKGTTFDSLFTLCQPPPSPMISHLKKWQLFASVSFLSLPCLVIITWVIPNPSANPASSTYESMSCILAMITSNDCPHPSTSHQYLSSGFLCQYLAGWLLFSSDHVTLIFTIPLQWLLPHLGQKPPWPCALSELAPGLHSLPFFF